jgi:[ribosomal protein S5]-alanine N-acetyltransferase
MDENAFLSGKTVVLRPPNLETDVYQGNWFKWFNNKRTTRYLGMGVFPNTRDKQVEFVESLRYREDKLVLCIIAKRTNKLIGVISFSDIDLLNRRANISLVLGEMKYPIGAPLEAMALMTEHGFDRLNLIKIECGQSVELWKWVNSISLLGYKLEGYREAAFIRDGVIHDAVLTGITANRFYRLREKRGGAICAGDIGELQRQRPKQNMVDEFKQRLSDLYSLHNNYLNQL